MHDSQTSCTPTGTPLRKTLLRVAAVVALVALVPVARQAFVSPATAAAKPEAKPVPVRTPRVQQGPLPITLSGIGTVAAAHSVVVHARIDGQLDRVFFSEGQDVKAGQPLAQLDDRALQAQLAQAQAQRARDEAQLANAEADLRRYEGLVKDKAATQQQLDTQTALVRQLRATLQADAANVRAAQVQLSYTRIMAPIGGRVGARLVDPGNLVHAADANGLVVINEIDPIVVQFALPDARFQDINAALNAAGGRQRIAVQALDRGSHALLAEGQLVLLNNQIDTSTGTVLLKARFANAQHRLWPGQQVDARLVLRTQADALTVPSAAIQRSQSGLFVYAVAQDDTVRVQPVRVAEGERGRSQVLEGLQPGERVVTEGQYRLMPGARVADVAASAAHGAASGAAR
jgi:membrane fusion protein, multidrug efflux system